MTVGLRPESLALASAGDGIPVIVTIVEELGAEAFVHAQLANKTADSAKAEHHCAHRAAAAPAKGDLIHLHVKEDSMLFFDAASGDRIAGRS